MQHPLPAEAGGPSASSSSSAGRQTAGYGDHRQAVPRSAYTSGFPVPGGLGATTREREHSIGGWSTSSYGTGDSRGAASSSVARSGSKRTGKGATGRTGLASGGPTSTTKRRRDKHALAIRSIREFLKDSSCYDSLPVSFRLVVLDTKLIVKPALDIMWQAGIVSAPLWQSTSESFSGDSEAVPGGASSASHGDAEGTSPAEKESTNGLPDKTGFAGMLTVNDIIHLIQYYYKNAKVDEAAQNVEQFRLGMLREIEHSLHVPPPPLLSIDPMRPIFDACQLLMKTHAHRLPLLDHDEHTGMDVVVSVLTQYRVLKFIAMNCRETAALYRTIRSLGIGTYTAASLNSMSRTMTMSSAVSSSRRSSNAAHSTFSPSGVSEASAIHSDGGQADANAGGEFANRVFSPTMDNDTGSNARSRSGSGHDSLYPLATVTLDTTVFDVVHIFSELGISGVPVLDEEGYAVDLFETVDVIDLVRLNAYQSLDLTIREAMARRNKESRIVMTVSPDDSLATIFTLLRTRRVHRMLILEPEAPEHGDVLGGGDPSVVGGNASASEQDRAFHSAVANDTGAAGDAHVGRMRSDGGGQAQKNVPLDLSGDIPTRKRGRLVGILCLSDIMRYIIASSSSSDRTGEKASGLRATASTATSSLDPQDAGSFARPRHGSVESAGGAQDSAAGVAEAHLGTLEKTSEGGLAAIASSDGSETQLSTPASSTTQINSAARFDPSDVPPTIEEHPVGEAGAAASNDVQEFLPEDQTPTQEKPMDAS